MSCDGAVFLPVDKWRTALLQDPRCGPVAQLPLALNDLPSVSLASHLPRRSLATRLHTVFARTEQWLGEWALLQTAYDEPLLLALRIDGALQALLLARAASADSDGHILLVQTECVNERDPPQLIVHGRSGSARRLWSITSSPQCATDSDCALHMLVHIIHFHFFRLAEQCLCDTLQKSIDAHTLLSFLDALGNGPHAQERRAQQLHASHAIGNLLQLVLNDVAPVERVLTLYQFAEALRDRVQATALHTGAQELSAEQRNAIDRELDELRETLIDSAHRLSVERNFALVLSVLGAWGDPACIYAHSQPYKKLVGAQGLQVL